MIKNKNSNISQRVHDIILPVIEELGYDLWDVKFVKEGPDWFLRVFIDNVDNFDNKNNIKIEDCEKVSRSIDKLLDIEDPIEQSYCLEVCSPGIERELSCDRHLEKYINSNVKIKFIRPDEDKNKLISGELVSFDKLFVNIKLENQEIKNISRKNISRINLISFDLI